VQALVRKYAFAIVFENSIVHDYVSEKVYGALQAALLLGTVVCLSFAAHRLHCIAVACAITEKAPCASALTMRQAAARMNGTPTAAPRPLRIRLRCTVHRTARCTAHT
jgi:hypothetical protein